MLQFALGCSNHATHVLYLITKFKTIQKKEMAREAKRAQARAREAARIKNLMLKSL